MRPRKSTSATRQTAAVTIATTVILRTSVPRIVQGRLSFASDAAGSPRVSSRWSMRSATLWSRKATAKVATSIVAADCVRSGRKTTRSIASESAITTREAEEDPDAHRPVPVGGEGERERARHHELAVGEVDEPEHAEDEADPDRHQRVDRADPDRVDLHLRLDRGAQEVGEPAGDEARHDRYAWIIRSVSPASSGVRVSRSSPFASTSDRSASATVRWARCSTSRTAIPRSRIAASASKTTSVTVGESPSEGSSSSSTSGAATSARAIASCCCWPPESAPALRPAELGDDGEHLADALDVVVGAVLRPPAGEAEPEVLVDGQLAEDAATLGDERDPAAARRPRAAGRRAETSGEPDRRRPRAGRAP